MFSIKDNDKYEEIIKYSKFISFIFRVYSKDEVNDYIDKIKKEYPNATHYCYGYVIDNDIKSSDDGEPSRTAGVPILNQITGNNLNYTLIIVVLGLMVKLLEKLLEIIMLLLWLRDMIL